MHSPSQYSADAATTLHANGQQALGVLDHYKRIASISAHMLAHAREHHWDTVIELGEQYQQAVESLKTLSPLSQEDREARRELLGQILDNDTSIRHLLAPELERLNALMGNLKRQQNVLQTYSSPIFSQ